jgi:hypothetical protein
VETGSPASSGGQGNYPKYISFPWPPLKAALPILNSVDVLLKTIFEMEVIKIKQTAIHAES